MPLATVFTVLTLAAASEDPPAKPPTPEQRAERDDLMRLLGEARKSPVPDGPGMKPSLDEEGRPYIWNGIAREYLRDDKNPWSQPIARECPADAASAKRFDEAWSKLEGRWHLTEIQTKDAIGTEEDHLALLARNASAPPRPGRKPRRPPDPWDPDLTYSRDGRVRVSDAKTFDRSHRHGHVLIDPSTDPYRMDLTGWSLQGGWGEGRNLKVYKCDGEKLTICMWEGSAVRALWVGTPPDVVGQLLIFRYKKVKDAPKPLPLIGPASGMLAGGHATLPLVW